MGNMCIKPNKEERTDVAMNPIASSNSVASPGQVTVGMPPVPNKPLPPVPQKASKYKFGCTLVNDSENENKL